MNKRIVIIALILLSGITACSDGDPAPQPVAETTVRLAGAIGQSTCGVIDSGYEKELAVSFARQDESSVSAGSYGAWGVHQAVRQGGAGNRPIDFAELQPYSPDGGTVRLHGVYPAVAEDASGIRTGKAVFTVDGMTDIMATGLLTATCYVPVRTCTFRHLLTQVRPVCYSNCSEEWGAVVKIEAEDVHTRQELDYGEAAPLLNDISSDTDIRNIAVQEIAGLSLPEVEEGAGLPEAQGYILLPVSPVNGTAEHPLHLRVTTTKDGRGNAVETVSRVAVTVEGGLQAGKRHIVSLFFTGGSKIETTSVSIEQWADRDAGEMPL